MTTLRSPLAGKAPLLSSLSALIERIEELREHPDASPRDRAWADKLYDDLTGGFGAAVSAPGCRAALDAYMERRRRSAKRGKA